MNKLINISIQGSDHIRHNTKCEDFGGVLETENCKIFATADGHGDSNCPRSDIGSKFVVDVTLSSLKTFHNEMMKDDLIVEFLSDSRECDNRLHHLKLSIVSQWNKMVNEHFIENPLTDEERDGASKYIERYDKGERIEHIYGTTLIAGLLTDSYLLLLQQGDGRCVVFDSDGIPSQPIPWDDRCFANVTTSMCDVDVIQSIRHHIVKIEEMPVLACFAGSDGVEDSFASMDLMYSYYRELLINSFEKGVDPAVADLLESLPEFSRTGSGDDVTITGFISEAIDEKIIAGFKRDNQVVLLNSKIDLINDRLKSMDGMGKLQALEKRLVDINILISKVQDEQEQAKLEYDSYVVEAAPETCDENIEHSRIFLHTIFPFISPKRKMDELKSLSEQRIVTLEQKLNLCTDKLDQLQAQKDDIEKEYQDFVERKQNFELEKEEILKEIETLI